MAHGATVAGPLAEYRGPVAFSVILHAAVILALSLNLSFCQREVTLPPPPAHVKAVVVERASAPAARPAPAPEPVAEPEPAPEPPNKPEPPKPEPKKPEPKKPVPKKPEPKKPETKKPEAKKPEPKSVAKPAPAPKPVEPVKPKPKPVAPDFNALLDQDEDTLASRDAQRKAADAQARREASARALQDQKTVSEFTALIRSEVERRWNRPPGTRSGMQAEFVIRLLPGGEVLDVQLSKSSGDAAFDRSAENAVRLAGRLPVPSDPALFNSQFRQFKFLFRPEGLKQ